MTSGLGTQATTWEMLHDIGLKTTLGLFLTDTNSEVPIINLALAPGERLAWGRPRLFVYLWAICEILFVTNPWQPSSSLRVRVLRLFGAKIGTGVTFRPRTRVKFPWKLTVGSRCWIGEGVWIHNQDSVTIENDVVLSQESFLTTGSHAHRKDMALITSPTTVAAGAWISTRAIVLGGVHIGRSCIVAPGSVVGPMLTLPPNLILQGNPALIVGKRFA